MCLLEEKQNKCWLNWRNFEFCSYAFLTFLEDGCGESQRSVRAGGIVDERGTRSSNHTSNCGHLLDRFLSRRGLPLSVKLRRSLAPQSARSPRARYWENTSVDVIYKYINWNTDNVGFSSSVSTQGKLWSNYHVVQCRNNPHWSTSRGRCGQERVGGVSAVSEATITAVLWQYHVMLTSRLGTAQEGHRELAL